MFEPCITHQTKTSWILDPRGFFRWGRYLPPGPKPPPFCGVTARIRVANDLATASGVRMQMRVKREQGTGLHASSLGCPRNGRQETIRRSPAGGPATECCRFLSTIGVERLGRPDLAHRAACEPGDRPEDSRGALCASFSKLSAGCGRRPICALPFPVGGKVPCVRPSHQVV